MATPDGYALYQAVVPAAEIRALLHETRSIPRSRAGARHLLGHAPVAGIAREPRLLAIAGGWLGAPALPFRVTLFDKNADSNWLVVWHQDTALPLTARTANEGWGPWSSKEGIDYAHAPASALERVIALRLHLDDATPENGPLRVLSGTHRLGVLTDAQVNEQARRIEPQACCIQAGGVMAMRPLLIHASSKSGGLQPRRVLHIEYTASMEIASGIYLRAA